jgi:hypothetical protein
MIPSSIVYFILGFVSAVVLIVAWGIITIKNENKRRKEMLEKVVNSLKEKDDEEE